jgi:hypothetical protein
MQLLEWLQVETTNSYPNKKYILQRSLKEKKKLIPTCVIRNDRLNNPKNITVHNISGLSTHAIFFIQYKHFQSLFGSDPQHSDIQMSMSKNRFGKIDFNMRQRLTLTFIYCHCKTHSQRELSRSKFERQFRITWN